MSDDEEFYDEFDDDDIIWIDDPDPDMADDLAGTSTYDPAFQEDPSLEAMEFFSDWDDLSDDYYDEDPTAVRRLRAMSAWLHNKADEKSLPAKRRKPNANNIETDVASFQGVVWKRPTDEIEIVELYAPGDGKKVALLENWREIFRDSKPAIGRLHMRMPNGLPSEPDIDGSAQLENGVDPDLEPDRLADSQEPSFVDDSRDNHVVVVDIPDSASEIPAQPKQNQKEHLLNGELKEVKHPSKFVSQEKQPAANGTRAKKYTKQGVENSSNVSPPRTRKRKASVSLDEQQLGKGENTKEAASRPRQKRVAPSRTQEITDRLTESSGPVRRSTRHKK